MKAYVVMAGFLFTVHLTAAVGSVAICLLMTHETWWQPLAFWGASFAIVTPIALGFVAAANWVMSR